MDRESLLLLDISHVHLLFSDSSFLFTLYNPIHKLIFIPDMGKKTFLYPLFPFCRMLLQYSEVIFPLLKQLSALWEPVAIIKYKSSCQRWHVCSISSAIPEIWTDLTSNQYITLYLHRKDGDRFRSLCSPLTS